MLAFFKLSMVEDIFRNSDNNGKRCILGFIISLFLAIPGVLSPNDDGNSYLK
jgi:hypothetical protein